MCISFDDDLGSGLDTPENRTHIFSQFTFGDVKRLHTWDHNQIALALSRPGRL